jgi:hypothetical protein
MCGAACVHLFGLETFCVDCWADTGGGGGLSGGSGGGSGGGGGEGSSSRGNGGSDPMRWPTYWFCFLLFGELGVGKPPLLHPQSCDTLLMQWQ